MEFGLDLREKRRGQDAGREEEEEMGESDERAWIVRISIGINFSYGIILEA